MTIVFGAVDQLGRDLQGIGGSAGASAAVSGSQAGDAAPQQLTFGAELHLRRRHDGDH
jgi:hypothetical protein